MYRRANRFGQRPPRAFAEFNGDIGNYDVAHVSVEEQNKRHRQLLRQMSDDGDHCEHLVEWIDREYEIPF